MPEHIHLTPLPVTGTLSMPQPLRRLPNCICKQQSHITDMLQYNLPGIGSCLPLTISAHTHNGNAMTDTPLDLTQAEFAPKSEGCSAKSSPI
jgi:hypothetical protein